MQNSTELTAQAEAINTAITEPKKRGRKPLPQDERDRRRAARAIVNRKKQEARRKALAILANRHDGEFASLYQTELSKLS